MSELSHAVKNLISAYARDNIDVETLFAEVMALDPDYFTKHGVEFKNKLESQLVKHNAKSPAHIVQARYHFYEVFFDHAIGVRPDLDA